MNISKVIKVCLSWFLGLMYFISGATKALSILTFADTLVAYGSKLYWLSPIIISIEIALALSFLLLWQIPKMAQISFFLTLLLTTIFLIGYLFLEVKDCGCYGAVIHIPVWQSLLRNLVMLISSFWLYKKIPFDPNKKLYKPVIAFSFGLLIFTYSTHILTKYYIPKVYVAGTNISNTFLQSFTKNDNQKRLVFVFMPSCKDCQKATAHVNSLVQRKQYKGLIGVYSANTKLKDLTDYIAKFKPDFILKSIPNDSILKVAHAFPTFVVLQNDKILSVTEVAPSTNK